MFWPFKKRPTYPHIAGHRDTDTSRDAAEAVSPTINERQRMVVDALRTWGPMTTVEVCEKLGFLFHQLQPRFSECRALGLIEDSGLRGKSRDPKRNGIIWRVVSEPDASKSDKTA